MSDGANNDNDKAAANFPAGAVPWMAPVAKAVLVAAVVVSALAVSYLSQQNRQLFAQTEALRREEAALDARWSRLLLERSTLTSPARVADEAARLGMRIPRPAEVVVVR